MKSFILSTCLMIACASTTQAEEDYRGKMSEAPYKKPVNELSEMQQYVVHGDGTEKPFENEYWDHKEEGIYVDIQSGEPLFSSTDKFDSGTGWPSFTRPIEDHFIVTKKDFSLLLPRTEIRSKTADSHLGHVFNDGPKEAGGMRYCVNSAALHFIPKEDLEARGYGKYKVLFEN